MAMKVTKLKTKPVLVRWDDSAENSFGWQYVSDMKFDPPVPIESVGTIIEETSSAIYMAAHIAREGQATNVMTIPKSAIRSIKKLVSKKRR